MNIWTKHDYLMRDWLLHDSFTISWQHDYLITSWLSHDCSNWIRLKFLLPAQGNSFDKSVFLLLWRRRKQSFLIHRYWLMPSLSWLNSVRWGMRQYERCIGHCTHCMCSAHIDTYWHILQRNKVVPSPDSTTVSTTRLHNAQDTIRLNRCRTFSITKKDNIEIELF